MHTLRRIAALSIIVSLTACVPVGEDGDGGDQDTGGGAGDTGGADAGGEDASGVEDGGSEDVGEDVGGEDAGGATGAIPTEADALFTWLQQGGYEGWPAESAVHSSTGPHGSVRTFIDPTLDASLLAENPEHPIGAASVKELHNDGGLLGWAVMVKTESGPTADSWYWYEVFSTTSGANPVADGNGVGLCAGCHASGADYVRTPYPLQ